MALGFLKSLVNKFSGRSIDWDDIEETLIRADLGVPLTMRILKKMQQRGGLRTVEAVDEAVKTTLRDLFPNYIPPLLPRPDRPTTILLLGVNGTGKTTSSAKLAHFLKKQNYSVVLAAADTFRAAAIEQLCAWGEKLDIQVIKGQYQSNPSALCYDAYLKAQSQNVQFLLCDTAGRLHTKSNLMQELQKVCRSLAKHHPDLPDEKWLVIDATTGTNALNQAKEFHQAVGLTGIIVTKLDGSGKGGIAAAIQEELGITPRFLGLGEKADDLQPFDRDAFIDKLL